MNEHQQSADCLSLLTPHPHVSTCRPDQISRTVPSFAHSHSVNSSNVCDSPRRAVYVQFPISANLNRIQCIMRSILPTAVVAASTFSKLEFSIFTKIKDELPHRHMYNRIILWRCPLKPCTISFLAFIYKNNVFDYINGLIGDCNSVFYMHAISSHSTIPIYPAYIKTLSLPTENTLCKLQNRYVTELARRPGIVPVSVCHIEFRRDIFETIKSINNNNFQ